jgi:aminoglycoside phosphotransferase family enzyme/predicted kinase
VTRCRSAARRAPWLVSALLDPAAYAGPVERVELVETHISWVFLAGDRVYKVKKPVDLGFLDFTTLRRRRFYCEEEVRLNRRLAAATYLRVIPIRDTPAGLRVGGGQGRALEVAVEMQRLPADRMLDRLVESRQARPELLRDIAATVARFHATAETGGPIDEMGRPDVVRRNWDENFAQTSQVVPDLWPPEARRALQRYGEAFFGREALRLEARASQGHIRDCHGDLQAQHVCGVDPIQIFDCIEFNPRFRFGDTAGEIAFLAMDLERLDAPGLAVAFLNAYLEESGDYGAVPLLDFYRAYRALVRAKVLSFQVAERPELAPEARALFALAGRFARERRTGQLFITSGVIGSGKSTVARAVAERLGALVIRTDAVRKHVAGIGIHERAAERFGHGLYSSEMTRRTYAEVLRLAGEAMAAGWTVVVDGSFSRAEERAEARALAEGLGARHAILWCDAADDVIAARLRRRVAERGEVSDGRAELLAEHRARYEPPDGSLDAPVIRVDTAGPVNADEVVRALGRPSA